MKGRGAARSWSSRWRIAIRPLRDLLFPDFSFELVPVALTVEQVSDLGLPSTPLKETEKRADRWRDAFSVEQTEIDALATLRPDTLRGIVEQALEPYFDDTLDDRVEEGRSDWEEEAQQAIDSQSMPRAWPSCARKRPSG